MRKANRVIFFDFDGVIADSFAVALEVNQSFFPDISADEYRSYFHGNVNDAVAKRHQQRGLKSVEEYFERYLPRLLEVDVFPGIDDVIVQLAKGATLIIVSSALTAPIERFLEKRELKGHFTEILGNDVHASKVEKFRLCLKKYQIEPSQCLLVTDTLGDIREASEAGIESIAVAWGWHDEATLLLGNPKVIVHTPNDILLEVDKHFV